MEPRQPEMKLWCFGAGHVPSLTRTVKSRDSAACPAYLSRTIVSRNLPILFRFSTSVHISTCEEGIIGIPQSRVSDETRRFMAELISWDLKSLRAAQFANRDWLGQEWPHGSWRDDWASLAARSLRILERRSRSSPEIALSQPRLQSALHMRLVPGHELWG